MTLLAFRDVSKRFPDGTRWAVVLDRVSFEVDAGETVGVFASRQAGKTTLLRIACGVESPDSGEVCWDGHNLVQMSANERACYLRSGGIALATGAWRGRESLSVLEYVSDSLYNEGLTMDEAATRARQALGDVQVGHLEDRCVGGLGLSERVRVGLAHAADEQSALLVSHEATHLRKIVFHDRLRCLPSYDDERACFTRRAWSKHTCNAVGSRADCDIKCLPRSDLLRCNNFA